MEKNLIIELLEDGDKVSLYSPRFEGEEYTEVITIRGTELLGELSFVIDD